MRWDASDAVTVRAAWHDNNSTREMSSATNTVQADGTITQVITGLYNDANDPLLSQQKDERGQAFVDVRFATGSIDHKLTAGLMYSSNVQERFLRNGPNVTFAGLPLNTPTYRPRPAPQVMDRGPIATAVDNSAFTWSIGDDVTFNDQWSLLAGVGYATIDDGTVTELFPSPAYEKSSVMPTVSLLFKPMQAVTTYVSYIEALERGGAAAEQFNGALVTNAGQVFEPLVSEQFEIGAKATLGNVLLTGAVFQIDKALQYYDITDPARVTYVQDGRQVHRGVELTAFGKLTNDLAIIGGLTLLDAKVKEQKQAPAQEGKRPIVVADQLAKLHVEYNLPFLRAVTVTGGVNYTSEQFGDALNTDRLPSYTLLDVGARHVSALGESLLTVRLDAYNLADKRYWANNGYLGDPRMISLSASLEF